MSKTFKQADSRWGSKNYNGSSTMAAAGCGPTSVAMIAYNMDTSVNPWTVATYMKSNGYAIRNAGTAWAGIPAALKHFGCEQVKTSTSMADVWSEMGKGEGHGYGIFLFRAGTKGGVKWTGSGHYIAVTDYKVVNGKHYLYTRDSGDRDHTGWYCYETQMKGLIKQTWTCYVPLLNGKARTSTSTTKSFGEKVVDYAASQKGSYATRTNHGKDGKQYTNKFIKYFEGKGGIKNGHLPAVYNYIPGYCTTFVCYVFAHLGYTEFECLNSKSTGYFWHAPGLMKWCKKKGYSVSYSSLKPGDVCFKGSSSPTHTCIFLKKDGDYIWTWDGNVGGGVTKNKRKKSVFCGYARFPEPSTTTTTTTTNTTTSTRITECIDVSKWQGDISADNWKKVAKSVGYSLIRSSYTSIGSEFKLNTDPKFANNVKNSFNAGIKTGAYHFSQAKTTAEAIKEADYMCDLLDKNKTYINWYVVCDWEFNKRLKASYSKDKGKTFCTSVIDAFCNRVKERGYTPMVYANKNTLTSYLNEKTYPIWVAQYASKCTYTGEYKLWQYTSSGSVDGISGKVDLSHVYGGE